MVLASPRHLGFADHRVCVMHAERTRHEECKTCDLFFFWLWLPTMMTMMRTKRALKSIASQFLAPRRPDRHGFRHESSGEVLGKTFNIRHHCVETSLAICRRYDGFRAEAARACTTSVHRQRLGGRQTHAQVRVFVVAGRIPDQRRCSNTVGGLSIIM